MRSIASICLAYLMMGVVLFFHPALGAAADPTFTQEDRDRLIRLEVTLSAFIREVDKRFEQIDKRFEQIDKRFAELDKRFEQIDKRFEQVDKRFEQLMTFLWMLVGIFTTLTAVNIGFAYWDRQTYVRRAKEETIQTIEREGKLVHLIQALRQVAAEDAKLASVLRSFGLL
ncbi:MAG: hypothetical protein AB1547_10405 [Thermodesulfobacteriota bacterium]